MPEAFDDVLKVAPLLETFRGRTAFFDELSGNNGDDLISDGSREAIKRAGIRCLDDPAAADLQIVTGGAGLSSVWGGAYERMKPYALPSAAERPMVVLPSTISIETFDLPALFRQRTAKTWVFARERKTLKRIADADWGKTATLGLDDDMAFHLKNSPWLKNVRARCRQQHLLIVERRDAEGLSGNQDRAVPVPSRLKRLVPDRIKRPLKRRRHEVERSRTPFARWAEDQARRRLGLPNAIPVRAVDVSLKGILTFPQFISLIADATAIVTTRLHVGILGALLEKPTFIVPGDSGYGKIQGIYEYSLKDNAGVELLENPFAK